MVPHGKEKMKNSSKKSGIVDVVVGLGNITNEPGEILDPFVHTYEGLPTIHYRLVRLYYAI